MSYNFVFSPVEGFTGAISVVHDNSLILYYALRGQVQLPEMNVENRGVIHVSHHGTQVNAINNIKPTYSIIESFMLFRLRLRTARRVSQQSLPGF